MFKRVVLVAAFVLIFALAATGIFYMQAKHTAIKEKAQADAVQKTENLKAEDVHVYRADDIASGCSSEDKLFCAIERTIKCTMEPELSDCQGELVPAFVLGKTQDAERPTEVSFKVTKIKPIPDSTDVSVYTESDCNAMWFGLCKGTVVYTLSFKGNDDWAVTNVYALE